MFVCICNGHRDRDLRRAADQGARTAREAYALLDGQPVCGTCLDMAQDIIDDHLAGDALPPVLMAAPAV